VRKRLKRLRYLAEFIAPLFKSRDVARWTKAVAAVQDALGHHIDLSLAAGRFEEEARVDPKAWFAVGWLRAQSRDSAHAARRNLKRLRHAHVFW
jgi:CHAD domain-containing protein